MGTYKRTLVTLNTFLSIPFRNCYGCTTFLVCGSSQLELAVCDILECGYRQVVAIHKSDRVHQLFYHLNCCRTAFQFRCRSVCFWVGPGSRDLYFVKSVYTSVDCFVVHLNNSVTLLAVGLLSSSFHVINCFFDWHKVSQFEECGLKDRVGTFAHTDLDRFVDSVDGV